MTALKAKCVRHPKHFFVCVFLPFLLFLISSSPPLPLPRLSYPSTTKDKFTADYHQKVVLRFSLTFPTTNSAESSCPTPPGEGNVQDSHNIEDCL